MADKIEFQADVSKMLDIVINSLYSEKQIFLQAIILNMQMEIEQIMQLL